MPPTEFRAALEGARALATQTAPRSLSSSGFRLITLGGLVHSLGRSDQLLRDRWRIQRLGDDQAFLFADGGVAVPLSTGSDD